MSSRENSMEGMHIVLSTKKDLAYPDALVKHSLDEAIKAESCWQGWGK